MAGIAVPVATRADGRPGSVTLLGPSGFDGTLAGIARTCMKSQASSSAARLALTSERPPIPGLAAGEMAVALVGAHMTGLPLNHEIAAAAAALPL